MLGSIAGINGAASGVNVGIGTATPGQKLTVVGTIESTSGGYIFPDSSIQITAAQNYITSVLRTRGITYIAGCDSCGLLTSEDSQNVIYANVIGAMTILSVTCFSDDGEPTVNISRNGTPVLSSNLTCNTTGTGLATSSSFVTGEDALGLDNTLGFVMAGADGVAKRVTVAIKTILN